MLDAAYPALFRCADQASNGYQRTYLLLIRIEFGLLLLAAIFSMNVFNGATFYLVYAALFVVLIVVLLVRALTKPEQDWYKCRALAESVKTLTWRYVIRAAPFGDAPAIAVPRAEFRDHLHRVFRANRAVAQKIDPAWSADDQITAEMDQVRALSFDDRKTRYLQERVQNQRGWYAKKAKFNREKSTQWVVVGVTAYLLAGGLALLRIRLPDLQFWPIEPIIVFASSVIGWVQIKKFSELSAAYTVTALEIGLISPKVLAATTEEELSNAINEAELAFSREHTLWLARQTD